MGTATDPYQHCEGRYRLTRGVVSTLADFEQPALDPHEVDVGRARPRCVPAADDTVATLTVSMSVGTLDERVRRVVEPGTPPGRKRLEVLARFADAGIRTGVLVAPILPGLSDDDEHLDEVLAACAAAGVEWASAIVLHVRPASETTSCRGCVRRTHGSTLATWSSTASGRTPHARTRPRSRERFARLRLRHGLRGGYGRATPQPSPETRGQLALAV